MELPDDPFNEAYFYNPADDYGIVLPKKQYQVTQLNVSFNQVISKDETALMVFLRVPKKHVEDEDFIDKDDWVTLIFSAEMFRDAMFNSIVDLDTVTKRMPKHDRWYTDDKKGHVI